MLSNHNNNSTGQIYIHNRGGGLCVWRLQSRIILSGDLTSRSTTFPITQIVSLYEGDTFCKSLTAFTHTYTHTQPCTQTHNHRRTLCCVHRKQKQSCWTSSLVSLCPLEGTESPLEGVVGPDWIYLFPARRTVSVGTMSDHPISGIPPDRPGGLR